MTEGKLSNTLNVNLLEGWPEGIPQIYDFKEEWVPVKGWEGKYLISNWGRVFSLSRKVKNGSGFRTIESKILKPQKNARGYYHVQLYDPHKTFKINRMMGFNWLLPVPENADKMHVCHGDDNPLKNSIKNLRWDTPRENILDIIRNGNNFCLNKTECPLGHSLMIEANLKKGKNGSRQCRSCAIAKNMIYENPALALHFEAIANIRYENITKNGSKILKSVDIFNALKEVK